VCNAKGEPWLWILQEKVGTDGNPLDPDLRDYILLRSARERPLECASWCSAAGLGPHGASGT
jgi:hypothetical protein